MKIIDAPLNKEYGVVENANFLGNVSVSFSSDTLAVILSLILLNYSFKSFYFLPFPSQKR